MDFSLLQEHTIRLYDLENHSYAIQKVKARSLLSVHRFDLFAKLYYAHYRKEEPELAKEVYLKHIKAFNPDGREPGRSDKVSFDDFVIVYDELLDHFSNHEFDTSKSIVPVSSDGMILDGAHRVAALAYYDKDITIAKFEGVIPVCQFNLIFCIFHALYGFFILNFINFFFTFKYFHHASCIQSIYSHNL